MADKQYADAKRALNALERLALEPGTYITYGVLAEQLGYEAKDYGRHIGQVCSLVDAACFWAKLPMLSLEKVRLDDGSHNLESYTGMWAPAKEVLIANSSAREWTSADIDKLIRTIDLHMGGTGAITQWERINSFGGKAVERLIGYK